jgi:hypothetical protein
MARVGLRALVLVVMALALAACTTSQTVHHQIAPFVLSTTAKPPPTVNLSATPVGWVPVADGDAQVSVPASFHVYYPGWLDCEPIGNALTLGSPTPSGIGCPSHQGPTMVNLSHIEGVPSEYRTEKPLKLNGVALYLSPSYGLTGQSEARLWTTRGQVACGATRAFEGRVRGGGALLRAGGLWRPPLRDRDGADRSGR